MRVIMQCSEPARASAADCRRKVTKLAAIVRKLLENLKYHPVGGESVIRRSGRSRIR